MNKRADQHVVEASIGWAFAHVLGQAKRAWATLADVLIVNAKARGAAILYEELSRLSDAELARRGLRRADLPRYIFKTMHRK
jgi:hypothetical protein